MWGTLALPTCFPPGCFRGKVTFLVFLFTLHSLLTLGLLPSPPHPHPSLSPFSCTCFIFSTYTFFTSNHLRASCRHHIPSTPNTSLHFLRNWHILLHNSSTTIKFKKFKYCHNLIHSLYLNFNHPSNFMSLAFIQFSSVAQSCPTREPMDCSTPGFPVYHQLPELAKTHVHQVGDVIQPSNPLSSPSPPTFNLSHHQGIFQWVGSLHQVAKGLALQL